MGSNPLGDAKHFYRLYFLGCGVAKKWPINVPELRWTTVGGLKRFEAPHPYARPSSSSVGAGWDKLDLTSGLAIWGLCSLESHTILWSMLSSARDMAMNFQLGVTVLCVGLVLGEAAAEAHDIDLPAAPLGQLSGQSGSSQSAAFSFWLAPLPPLSGASVMIPETIIDAEYEAVIEKGAWTVLPKGER